ncbi:glycosyl hydrolase [Aquisphaera insulae]|uniref:glycosyl hydrolase n=1 Tax=Aquisphaera insulae TaxID=2712864 RepID=UPI0013EB595B|nr:glycosyl hydrolase [Aquisphaera insulae]
MTPLWLLLVPLLGTSGDLDPISRAFDVPPAAARPWVYWMVMDGNFSRAGITADLEAMRAAGLGGAILLETDLGLPRGPVRFGSPEWVGLVAHAAAEARRLGLQLALPTGPGWCGTGGAWVRPEHAMQHLVATATRVKGPSRYDGILPRPAPRKPFFGVETLTPELARTWRDFYRDVAVLAFPSPAPTASPPIADLDEQALVYRAPYSSQPGVRAVLPAPSREPAVAAASCVAPEKVLDLTASLGADGRLAWDVPDGTWTILRLGRTLTGQTTRPAPAAGLGFETDKLAPESLDAHLDRYLTPLLEAIPRADGSGTGLTTLHFDSWEMGSQNASPRFLQEFAARRKYDPRPYLPVLAGLVVGDRERSERFLWDLRRTAQELTVANHLNRLRDRAHGAGLELSVEPYDMNPAGDLELGAAADVPMGEFWSAGHGFKTEHTVFEAVSIAHVHGRPIVGAEAFTAAPGEDWRLFPGALKSQADWALASGLNRLVIHRYQHQPEPVRPPGWTMGPYGVHWERTQTWWPMVSGFHDYLARNQALLRVGRPVADILFLTPEGAPSAFRAPGSATQGDPPDRRGYNFDGCDPDSLIELAATDHDGRIAFPGGASYRVLVLPQTPAMTPRLVRAIGRLLDAGGTVVAGPAPARSPSLEGYPGCDQEVARLAAPIWKLPRLLERHAAGQLYPDYDVLSAAVGKLGLPPDFESDIPLRYTHRRDVGADLYFVANPTSAAVTALGRFRTLRPHVEWWDPLEARRLAGPSARTEDGRSVVPLQLGPFESGWLVFRDTAGPKRPARTEPRPWRTLEGPWRVEFDRDRGGPPEVVFDRLDDWARRPEPEIRAYSGRAVYRKRFDLGPSEVPAIDGVDLGHVECAALVRLNGRDLGPAWCFPWRVRIPAGILRAGANDLEITVANLWINRLAHDAGLPEAERRTWTTLTPYRPGEPPRASGLLGPVRLESHPAGP